MKEWELTLTPEEIDRLAMNAAKDSSTCLRFTNLANKRAVQKRMRQLGYRTFSRTAHGSLLDPRYTVEGSNIPDRGFANNYDQMQPYLYCLEVDKNDRSYLRGW